MRVGKQGEKPFDGICIVPGGGYFRQNHTGCPYRTLKNLTFFAQLPTHSYSFFDRKRLMLPKLGAFYNNLLKIHPLFFLFGLLRLWRKPTDRYTKFREKAPQKAGTYTYTKSMWDPSWVLCVFHR